MKINLVFILLVLWFLSIQVQGKEQAIKRIPTLLADIQLDGELNEEAWENAPEWFLDIETEPTENTAASAITTAKVFFDDETLYIGFIALDNNPEEMLANQTSRDSAWEDDLVGIRLDTYNDSKLAYQFFVNPRGVQHDAIENELNSSLSKNWDAVWHSEAKITSDGYVVEIAIPLEILNFNSEKANQKWAFEFIRHYPRSEKQRFSNLPDDRNNSCGLCQLAPAEVSPSMISKQNLMVIPYISSVNNSFRNANNPDEWEDSSDLDVGLDLRWRINSNSLMNVTINPDFSQVESDVTQVGVNKQFALYFEEKRTFFLENNDYFETENNFLHTRNIIDPTYGVKYTSKGEKHSYAFLAVNDRSTTTIIPGNLNSKIVELEEETQNIALRHKVNSSSSLSFGSLLTARKSSDYHNYLLAADINYRVSDQDTVSVQKTFTDTEYPEYLSKTLRDCSAQSCNDNELSLRAKGGDKLQGNGLSVSWDRENSDYFSKVSYDYLDSDFRADLGFVNQVDSETIAVSSGLNWYPENMFLSKASAVFDWNRRENTAGEMLKEEFEVGFRSQGEYQSIWEGGVELISEVGARNNPSDLSIAGNSEEFDLVMSWFYGEGKIHQNVWAGIEINYGDAIDYEQNQEATAFRLVPNIRWNINESLTMNLVFTYDELFEDGYSLYVANLLDFRLTYSIDNNSYVRFINSYEYIDRSDNPIYSNVENKFKNLSSQLLYGYELNTHSNFYLGYSIGMNNGYNYVELEKDRHSLFAKFSYAFNK